MQKILKLNPLLSIVSLILSLIHYKLKKIIQHILFYFLIVLPFILIQLMLIALLIVFDVFFVHRKKNITNRPLIKEGNGYVAVIIPNYQGEPFLEELLNSLMNQTYPLLNIYVVDNGSNDNSRQIIERYTNVKWIDNGKNLGFSAAVNRGVKEAEGAEFYVLLNNDTVVEPNWAEELVKEMRSDPALGAVGALIFLSGMKNTLNLYAHALGDDLRSYNIGATTLYSPEIYPPQRYVLSASGCSIMYRAIAFHDTGLFDDNYFLCYEDFDFNLRMFWKGWKTKIAHSSRLFHISNASMETGSYTHVYYLCRNQLYPFIKVIPSYFMIRYFKNVLFGYIYSAEIRLFFKWQGLKILLYRVASFKNFLALLRDRRQILSQRRRDMNELNNFITPLSELSISKTYRLSTGETYLKNVHKSKVSIKGIKVKTKPVNFSGIIYFNELHNGKAKSKSDDPQIFFDFPKRNSFPNSIYFEIYCETVSWGQIIFFYTVGKDMKHLLVSNHFRVHAGWGKYLFRMGSRFWNWEVAIPDFFGLWKKSVNGIRIDPCEIGDVKIGLRNAFLIYNR